MIIFKPYKVKESKVKKSKERSSIENDTHFKRY